jgi:hypothetical protein
VKAYISMVIYDSISPEGRDASGTENCHITREYQSLENLKRYAFKDFPKGKYHIEAYHDFDNDCYGEPDIDTYHTVS